MPMAEPRNYTVEIEHGAAVVRVFRTSGMAKEQVLASAKDLLVETKNLTRDEHVHGLVLDVRRNGQTIPAVAQYTKQGLLFIFNRVTGTPIYGVEERPVLSDNPLPGDE